MNESRICTVIIPTIPGREEYLNQAMKSYYLQNSKLDSEIIVEYGGTLSENINKGLVRAKGKWIKILADDDLLIQGSLSKMVAFANYSDYDWIYANAYNFSEFDVMPPGWQKEHKSSCNGLKQMLDVNTIHGGTTLYKKSMLFEVGGYDESLDTAEEYDLHLNLLKHGYKHGYYNAFVYNYRLHPGQKSNSMGEKLKLQRKKDIETYIKSRYV